MKRMTIEDLRAEERMEELVRYDCTCSICGNVVSQDEAQFNYNNNWVCYDCIRDDRVAECSCCGILYDADELSDMQDGGTVCNECLFSRGATCPQCGEVFIEDYAQDDGLCPLCADKVD